MEVSNQAIAERIEITKKHITIYGHVVLKYKELSDYNKKILLIENEDEVVVEKNLINELRTDLTFRFKDDNTNYDNAGFKPIKLDITEFHKHNGKYKIYIKVEDGINNYKIPLEVKLAEEKNKLYKIYYNIEMSKKRLVWNFCEYKYWQFEITNSNNRILLNDKVREFIKLLKRLKYFIKQGEGKTVIAFILYMIIGFYIRHKKIWLIGERKDTAQDNSYHLFNYIIQKHKNINAYYIIEKQCKDANKIVKKRRIKFGSIKHTMYLLGSKYSINSYSERANMYTTEYKNIMKYYPNLINRKKIFLQHGVIATSRINHSLHKNRVGFDMFFVSSNFEKDHIVKEFGYRSNEVKVTGLCRWDKLYNINKNKIILIMPTWRSWIKTEEELIKSKYLKTYISLVSNPKLIDFLKSKGYRIKFFMHYQMQKIIEDKDITIPKEIEFILQGEIDIQDIIRSSDILITDYSSVAFDFGFMKKEVYFYEFDYHEFYNKHYNYGPIEHKKDLFGIVVESEYDLINVLINNVSKDIELNSEYRKKVVKFIDKFDNRNTERVFNEILRCK
ncbi:MAG: CDP-glycerol glycerophosphotransferase family protein [Clostridium sp.]